MASLETLAGVVTNVRALSTTSGSMKKGDGQISTQHHMKFRIGNRAVTFSGSPNIGDGDAVTVSGKGSGEFKAMALRNDSTGLVYKASLVPAIIGFIAVALLSIPGFIFIGSFGIIWLLVDVGLGWLCFNTFKEATKANELLESAIPATSPQGT
jgi:hypothetical protein